MISVKNDIEAGEALKAIAGFLKDPRCERDLSAYREVVHIGDLQGCHAPLIDPASPVRNGLDPKVFYVFLGDLFDRGPENGEVATWFIENALGRPNVALIAGNHEDYVDKQALAGEEDIDLPNSEWLRLSWPEIKAAGHTAKDMARISEFSQDYLAYRHGDREVLCSHAGFGKWPSRMELVSRHQMRRGNGRYAADVDAMWSTAEAETGRFQLHGHRNDPMSPTLASPLSFNLEGQVEFGGHMRFVRLDANGFSGIDIRAKNHRTMQQDVAINQEIGRMSASKFPPIMPWAARDVEAGRLSRETLNSFRDHDMISIKRLDAMPGLVSVNFTREAFHKAAWDGFTTLARGLFVDSTDNSIVARSFPKFFNRDERPETTDEGLIARMKFPIDAFEKSNGFLCITGFSERLNQVVIASKSTIEGDFAMMADEILRARLGDAGIERILRLNRDQKCSLVFEIEDPERDPHIIKLDQKNAVLLACIRRAETFEQASYDDLKKIADWVGCDVKKSVARLPNEHALAAFNRRVESDPKWTFEGRKVEGVVLEDQSGQFCKLKTDFYRNWKFMRSAVNDIRKTKMRGDEPKLGRFADVPEPFLEFQAWASTLSVKALESDIITLREAFENDRGPIEAIVDDTPIPKPQEDRFLKLLRQIDANEKITPEGLAGFIRTSLEDPLKADILRGYENFEKMRIRAAIFEDEPAPGL